MHYLGTNRNTQFRPESSDVNYSLNFSANGAPAPAPECRNYHDLLDVLQGLSSFARAEWYESMTDPLKMLRLFVESTMDIYPGHKPHRV
ncbi:hypothetical protein PHMEG_00022119 [Phytophthora megakarya]|uniref:Uncharacterized protein n=1 Tax=Phytophthora megakarya TaxID=4795 RepID=A0A225VK02_9STRA|nr:hypothetical protein PHMEG_00022119 [Phytophthora megakarya]